jgi:hypothetical protein
MAMKARIIINGGKVLDHTAIYDDVTRLFLTHQLVVYEFFGLAGIGLDL